MRKFALVLGMVVASTGTPIVASGQGIEAKLGDATSTFVVKDSLDQEILVLEANTYGPNVIGGYNDNSVASGMRGATICGGGGLNPGGTPMANAVEGYFGTVGGGAGNQAGLLNYPWDNAFATVGGGAGNTASNDSSTVGGGLSNTASGVEATVGGGESNVASGSHSAVPGGDSNGAAGSYSFAAGRRAKANNQGCFVWGDSTNSDVTCSTNNRWIARAIGGVDFFTNATLSSGVTLAAGGSSWGVVSDRAIKENFSPVDRREVLEKVAAMPIEQWSLKTQDPSIRHIGPVAQDFNAAFGFEESERHINTMDATGVTMAAVQGLYEVVQSQKKEIEELRKEVTELRGLVREAGAPE